MDELDTFSPSFGFNLSTLAMTWIPGRTTRRTAVAAFCPNIWTSRTIVLETPVLSKCPVK